MGNFVQFLHLSGFASQRWSIRHHHPDRIQPSSMMIAAPPSLLEDGSAARVGPVTPRQQGSVLYNRDLCRIIICPHTTICRSNLYRGWILSGKEINFFDIVRDNVDDKDDNDKDNNDEEEDKEE